MTNKPGRDTAEIVGGDHFNFADSVGVGSFIFAVLALILNPPLILKALLLPCCCVGCFVFARKSHWTHTWNIKVKYAVASIAVAVIATIAIPQLRSRWKLEHPLPLVVSISYRNIFPSSGCLGYELSFAPEPDTDQRPLPLEAAHLDVRFPEIVRNYRVMFGARFADTIDAGCRFTGPPSTNEISNAKISFDSRVNELSFDAHSFSEGVIVELLTDEKAPDVLGESYRGTTSSPPLIEYDGSFRYRGEISDRPINFHLDNIDLFSVYEIKNSSPETFSIVHGAPILGQAKSITRPMSEAQLRLELGEKGKNEKEIDATIEVARKHQDDWAPVFGFVLANRPLEMRNAERQ
jgi:hypothetical protein